MTEFKSVDYMPPDGWLWYADEFGKVQSRNRIGIITAVSAHFRKTGRPVPYNPMRLVMECMCPHLPNGVCTEPSKVTVTTLEQVRDNSRKFFSQPVLPYDEVEARLMKCQLCPAHDRRFCPGCGGYPQWIDQGFGGKRKALPVDQACGVCTKDKVLVSVAASVKDAGHLGEEAPDGCWRK